MNLSLHECRCGHVNAVFFSIFSLFHGCYLLPLNCAIELQLILFDFVIDFAIFTWLQTDGETNSQTDQQMDGSMDGPMVGLYFSPLQIQ